MIHVNVDAFFRSHHLVGSTEMCIENGAKFNYSIAEFHLLLYTFAWYGRVAQQIIV